MKVSSVAIYLLGLTASSVSAFTASPLFAKVPQHALRMAEDEAVVENPVDSFKQKQSEIRNVDKKVSIGCIRFILFWGCVYSFVSLV